MQPDTTSNQPSNHPGKSAVFYVAGGYGKNLIATVPVRELARRGYRVQVIASHPRAWIGNPYVERIHPIGGTYLHEAIAAADALVHVEPYHDRRHILSREHCAQTWTRLAFQACGEPLADLPDPAPVPLEPVVRSTGAELAAASTPAHPYAVIQSTGGADKAGAGSWVRDIPPSTAARICKVLTDRGLDVYQLRSEHQPGLVEANPLTFPGLRLSYPWLANAAARVLIDSSAAHIAAGLGAPSVVCWPIASRARVFGYTTHENLTVTPSPDWCRPPSPGLIHEYDITGRAQECPHPDLDAMFDAEAIADAAVRLGKA